MNSIANLVIFLCVIEIILCSCMLIYCDYPRVLTPRSRWGDILSIVLVGSLLILLLTYKGVITL